MPDGAARAIVEGGPFPILLVGTDGAIAAANEAARSALGYSHEALVGIPFGALLDSGSHAKGVALVEAAWRGPTPPYELNLVGGDGRVVLLTLQGMPIAPIDDARATVALMGQLLAPAVATTERLLEANRQLGALFTVASTAAQAPLLPDLADKALEVMLTELGLRAGAVLLAEGGADGTATVRLAAQRGFRAELATGGAAWQQRGFALGNSQETVIRSGGLDEVGFVAGDLTLALGPLVSVAQLPLRSKGRLVGWLLAVSDAYRAFGGSELRALHTIGQLLGPPIEQARLFAALVERSGQLQAVLDGIDSGVMLVDNGGMVRYANARLGTLLATDVSRWPGLPRSALPLAALKVQPHGASLLGGELLELPGTPRRFLRHLVDAVADSDGTSLGMIEIFSDVTAVEEMNQLKDDFIAAAAHDLKTPVTAVKGYAQIALRLARRGGDPRLVQQLELVTARSDDLTAMMETLLDLSRIQSGRLELDVASFPLNELVMQVAERCNSYLQRQARNVEVSLPPESPLVVWDRARIGRVLINLIDNTIKYSPDGGSIALAVAPPRPGPDGRPWVELAVTDHGIGVPPAERERVFERFYRTTSAIADGFNGTGLGLYICQQFAHAHGGTITIEDARHGGPGTTVAVRLPQH